MTNYDSLTLLQRVEEAWPWLMDQHVTQELFICITVSFLILFFSYGSHKDELSELPRTRTVIFVINMGLPCILGIFVFLALIPHMTDYYFDYYLKWRPYADEALKLGVEFTFEEQYDANGTVGIFYAYTVLHYILEYRNEKRIASGEEEAF